MILTIPDAQQPTTFNEVQQINDVIP